MKERRYPNETIRLLHERSSCRSFHDKEIPPEVLQLILEAGVHAPTGGNLQPYSIIKIEDKETNRILAKLCGDQPWIGAAPVNLLFCIDWHRLERWAKLEMAPFTGRSSFQNFWISFQDVIIAAQNICTAADSMGLGSVYIGTVLECFRELRDMFELPQGVFPVVLLCLGYPKSRPGPARKLGVDTVVHDEKYRHLTDEQLVDAFESKYPGRRREITKERLEIIERACREVHGEEFARKCLDRIDANGYINQAQYLFGLHYCADEMPTGNETYMEIMEEFGFDWFKKYHSPGRQVIE
jgi:nitroreductase